tara:strand:- start:808 stop:1074 length:267 start_codon:yes stop_codon:yes gene_type:complete
MDHAENETGAIIDVLEKHGVDFDSERFCIYRVAEAVDTLLCDVERVVDKAREELRERDRKINGLEYCVLRAKKVLSISTLYLKGESDE